RGTLPHQRPPHRHRMGAGSHDGHRAPRRGQGHRPVHTGPPAARPHAVHVGGGAHVPVVDGRRGRRARGQTAAARGVEAQSAPPATRHRTRRRLTNSRTCAPEADDMGFSGASSQYRPRVVFLAVPYAMSVAGIQTLGASLTLEVVREADALGYDSAWAAEANAVEAMALLG